MMVGMYGSNEEFDTETCRRIIELAPKCTRIYPTLVLKGTELERLYEQGEYVPYSLEQAVMVSKDCLVNRPEGSAFPRPRQQKFLSQGFFLSCHGIG